MWPPSGRICRSSSSLRRLVAALMWRAWFGHAQRRVHQRDHRLQPRHAVARLGRGVAQLAHLARQAAQEAAVEPHVGIVEHQRRLADPGDDPARDDLGPPGGGVAGALQRDPFVDQRARIGAGDAGVGGAQMAQPAEAVQRHRPVLGRRRRSRTASARRRPPPCRRTRSGRHRSRSRGWSRRCADPAARSAAGRARPAGSGRRASESPVNRPSSLRAIPRARNTDNRGPFRDRSARHRRVRSPHCGRAMRPAGRTIPERRDGGQPTVRLHALDPAGVEAVEPAHSWLGIRQLAGQGAQVAGGVEEARQGRRPRPPRPDGGARGDRAPAARSTGSTPSSGSSEQVQ